MNHFFVENEEGVFVEEEEAVLEEETEENNEEAKLKKYEEAIKLFEVSIDDFNYAWWPLVSNIWTRFSYKNHANESIPLEKQRKTKIRPSNLCSAKIGVLHFVGVQKVQIERYNNSLDYTHILRKSEVLKHSDIVRKLVEEEAVKNYLPPTIMSMIKDCATRKLDLDASVKELKRKEVSNIKQRV
ncbi:41764_t:CDS:2 [Gigaspora margarita]|uniref:41764_t:CDS:1 n=1 Tax=Gigaspora margarita TaxID=4874 RepID=A0ABN7W0T0_GIGMA|nr:41764_t:CDS:2 [Gigaspora margarita]